MHIHVSFNYHNEYQPIAWSIGYCPSCQQEGAAQIENVVEVMSIWEFFPVSRSPLGQAVRCDFCRRHLEWVRDEEGIELDQWSPRDGLPSLLAKLGIPEPMLLPESASDLRLDSLLWSVEKATSISRVPLTPIGMGLGGLTAALAMIPLAMWLYEDRIVQPAVDELGFGFMMCGVSAIFGVLIGATIETLLKRNRNAFTWIEEAHAKYRIDLDRLEELSQRCSRRVRKAVRAVRAKAALEPEN